MLGLAEAMRLTREFNVANRRLAEILDGCKKHHGLLLGVRSVVGTMDQQRRGNDVVHMGQRRLIAPGFGVVPWGATNVPKTHIVVETRTILRRPVINTGTNRRCLEAIGLSNSPATKDAAITPPPDTHTRGVNDAIGNNFVDTGHQVLEVAKANAVITRESVALA